MAHERLMQLKNNLLGAIEGQMCNIYDANCEELGAAIDMLKDLEEAIYYCTITEAMTGHGKYGTDLEVEYGNGHKKNGHHQVKGDSQMYYPMYMDGSKGYKYNPIYDRMYNDEDAQKDAMSHPNGEHGNSGSSSSNYTGSMRDYREGRSPESRRMYMEAKEMQKDKAIQLRELEKYMQELSQDITDMIADAAPEEKQYLEKTMTSLASKIGQMK